MGDELYEEIYEGLVAAGFSKYEARATVALLLEEPLSPAEISEMASIPQSKIKDTLNKLMNRGIIRVVIDGKRKKYQLIDPRISIAPLLEESKRKIQLAEKIVKNIPSILPKETIQVAKGKNSVLKLAEKAVRSAEREVWATARDFSTPRWFIEAVRDGVERGVEFYLMGRIRAEYMQRVKTYQKIGVHIKRVADELPVMIIVDNRVVFFKTGHWNEAVAIYSEKIAKFMKKRLEALWETAIPV